MARHQQVGRNSLVRSLKFIVPALITIGMFVPGPSAQAKTVDSDVTNVAVGIYTPIAIAVGPDGAPVSYTHLHTSRY